MSKPNNQPLADALREIARLMQEAGLPKFEVLVFKGIGVDPCYVIADGTNEGPVCDSAEDAIALLQDLARGEFKMDEE